MSDLRFPARTVERESIERFAVLSGDHSRVQMDQDCALSMGLKENFAHGLLPARLSQSQVEQGEVAIGAVYNFATPVIK